MKKKVLIFDDESEIRTAWREKLEDVESFSADFEAVVSDSEGFKATLADLEKRQKAARSGDIDWCQTTLLDKIDMLFVDYDLLTLYDDKFEVGENVAYLARCYSRCRIIIALNQYGQNDFDLSLRGHPESFADLNLGSEQIHNPALWDPRWDSGHCDAFRPWHWPHLPTALSSFESRCEELMEEPSRLDETILSYLGFLGDSVQILPRKAVEFIHGGEGFEGTTFRDFVVSSGNGLHRKDIGDDVTIARVAAARLGKWLERLVLAGQDVLVDAPHLVTRFPGLLPRDRIMELEAWNGTSELFEPGIEQEVVADFGFRRRNWLSRLAWFGRMIDDPRDALDPWDLEVPGFVFCEDRSAFRPGEAAREFVADVPSAFVRRFVGDPPAEGVRYQPSVRFSM